MNKERRKRIEDIVSQLRDLKDEIEEVKDEERDAFENLPFSIQESERGQQIEEYANDLESAYEEIDSTISYLEEILEC